MSTVLLIHAAATWAMVGLIWFVQLVHYPLFADVEPAAFVRYEAGHTRRTAWVVGALMPTEAITAAWLAAATPTGINRGLALLGLMLVAVLWLSTAVWQAPLHGRLSARYDVSLQQRLVRSNWLRTALWSARGGIVLVMLAQAGSG